MNKTFGIAMTLLTAGLMWGCANFMPTKHVGADGEVRWVFLDDAKYLDRMDRARLEQNGQFQEDAEQNQLIAMGLIATLIPGGSLIYGLRQPRKEDWTEEQHQVEVTRRINEALIAAGLKTPSEATA